MSFSHKSDPYGPFKCQYTCNADASCNAYFVWYGKCIIYPVVRRIWAAADNSLAENVGTDDEYLNCVLFDAM